MPRQKQKIPITWTNVGGTDYSQPILVADFRDIVLTVVGTGTATVLGTCEITNRVVFSSASTISNSYAAMVIADLGTPNTYAASLAVAGATKLGEVNTNSLGYICVTRSANTLDAFIMVTDNQ